MGEELSYDALGKDLRPSLDWCPEKGWTMPVPMPMVCTQPYKLTCLCIYKLIAYMDIFLWLNFVP